MNRQRRFRRLVPAVLLAAASWAAGAEGIHLPAARQTTFTWVVTDKLGYRWDINGDGNVADGTDDAYDGGMRLLVNGATFDSQSTARLAARGTEVEIGPWRAGDLTVWRRILVNTRTGYCRWIDIFENASRAKVHLTLRYSSNMGESTQSVHTTSGKAQLGKDDWGVVTAASSTGSSRPAIVHVFAAPNAEVRPTFHFTKGSDDLHTAASFDVGPGKAAALCLFQAQRRPYAEAVKFLKAFDPVREVRSLPAALRRILLNLPSTALLTVGGVELRRSEQADLVIPASGDEILGRIANQAFALQTEFGQVKLAPGELLGLAGGGVAGRTFAFLTTGQVLVGQLLGEPVTVRMPGGTELKVPADRLVQAAYRITPDKPRQAAASGALLCLRGGSRLAFPGKGRTLAFLTAHGQLDLSADHLRSIELDTPEGGLHRAVFANGSVLAGLLTAPRVQMKTRKGLAVDVPRQRVERFAFAAGPVDSAKLAQIRLTNDDVLYGKLAEKTWTVRSKLGSVPVSCGNVLEADFSAAAPGRVKLVLRGGTKLNGQLASEAVGFEIQPGPVLKVHVTQIQSYRAAGREAEAEADEPPPDPPALPAGPIGPPTRGSVPFGGPKR